MYSAFLSSVVHEVIRGRSAAANRSAPAAGRGSRNRMPAVAAAVFLTGAALLGAAGPAAASQGTPASDGGVSATLGALRTSAEAVVTEDGEDRRVPAGLYEMAVEGGGTLLTYGTDLTNPAREGSPYDETSWRGSSLDADHNAGRVRWVLENSYPQVNDLRVLARRAGVPALTEEQAAAGTQVAIWTLAHGSDGPRVAAADPRAQRLAAHLRRSARELGEPRASLSLEPAAVAGEPGTALGPVTVRTGSGQAGVAPPADAAASGVRVVDKAGRPVTSAADGDQVFFEIPKDTLAGTAELTVQTSTTVPLGRALTARTHSETQVVAGSSVSTVTAEAGAHWASAGPVPAITGEKDCTRGGVDLTVANKGEAEFTFGLSGYTYATAPGETRTVTVPVREDQAYDFTVDAGSGQKRFIGVLDCENAGAPDGTAQLAAVPQTAVVGGVSAHAGDLADSGNSSPTKLIASVAVGLVVVGGAALFFVRTKQSGDEEEPTAGPEGQESAGTEPTTGEESDTGQGPATGVAPVRNAGSVPEGGPTDGGETDGGKTEADSASDFGSAPDAGPAPDADRT